MFGDCHNFIQSVLVYRADVHPIRYPVAFAISSDHNLWTSVQPSIHSLAVKRQVHHLFVGQKLNNVARRPVWSRRLCEDMGSVEL
jgi:hypothetical protein